MSKPITNTFYLSDHRKVYVGTLPGPMDSSLAAPMLFVSLGDDIKAIDKRTGQRHLGQTILTAPCSELEIDVEREKVLLIVLDYVCLDWQRLRQNVSPASNATDSQALNTELKFQTELKALGQFILRTRPSADSVFELIGKWIESLDTDNLSLPDARVVKAVDYIEKNRNRDVSIDDIARHVELSVPRLSQLFKQVTGVATRRLKLWTRAHAVATYIGEGYTLGQATKKAGFSDYSHFSRTFKEISGLNPSILFSAKAKVMLALPDKDIALTQHYDQAV